jgi:beta-galactosidase
MVWQEVAGWQFIGNASWQEHVVSDVREMIIRDRSRPSVVIWGTQVNESPRQPTLYTQTRQLAHSLDDSRQTSGTETSQSLTDWVGDVFAFDDYRSTDGNAHLLPPLTAFPYLITEAVGALMVLDFSDGLMISMFSKSSLYYMRRYTTLLVATVVIAVCLRGLGSITIR